MLPCSTIPDTRSWHTRWCLSANLAVREQPSLPKQKMPLATLPYTGLMLSLWTWFQGHQHFSSSLQGPEMDATSKYIDQKSQAQGEFA